MTVESDLYTALSSLVSARVYPDVAPNETALPYLTFQQVGGTAVSFMERDLPSKKHGTFQINVWATTRAGASALMLQVESAIAAATAFQAGADAAPLSTFDLDSKSYGALQYFSIWSDR